jgi:hypothetical protein
MLTDAQTRNAESKEKSYKLPKELGLFLIANPKGSKWWRFSYSLQWKIEDD